MRDNLVTILAKTRVKRERKHKDRKDADAVDEDGDEQQELVVIPRL